jgi:UDP-glucose 4-epimerase
LAELLVAVNGSGDFALRSFPGDRQKIDIGDFYADYRLISEKLGWQPRMMLRAALTETLGFYRNELPHYL